MQLHALLKSIEIMADDPSAHGVHLIRWGALWPWVRVQKLDGLPKMYTHCRLIAPLLAALAVACATPALAQTYASAAAAVSASASASDDDSQSGSLLTIHKRVDE